MRLVSCLLAVVFVLGASCAAPRGALSGDGTFVRQEVRYHVTPPEGWRRVNVAGADLAWANAGASLLVNSHCKGVQDAPLHVLTTHLMFGMTEREVVEQREVQISRRAGLESRVRAKLDGVAREMAILVVKKDGCVYDVVLDASPARFAAALPIFERMRDGFDVLTRGSR